MPDLLTIRTDIIFACRRSWIERAVRLKPLTNLSRKSAAPEDANVMNGLGRWRLSKSFGFLCVNVCSCRVNHMPEVSARGLAELTLFERRVELVYLKSSQDCSYLLYMRLFIRCALLGYQRCSVGQCYKMGPHICHCIARLGLGTCDALVKSDVSSLSIAACTQNFF